MRINTQTVYDKLGEEKNKNKVGESIDSARIKKRLKIKKIN